MLVINQFKSAVLSVLKINKCQDFIFFSRVSALFRRSRADETKRERTELTDARAHAPPLVMKGES